MKVFALFLLIAVAAYGAPTFHYEPEQVTLSGVIRRQVFPGRPNYEDVSKGDEPEVYWILELSTPMDVIRNTDADIDAMERGVRATQLVFGVLSSKSYADY